MKLRLLIWDIRDKFWERRIRRRYRKPGLKQPVYDRKKDVYYVEGGTGHIEEGGIEYIASEYSRTGLIYHFSMNGEVDHEHTFSGVLTSLLRDKGCTFSIPSEYILEYSEQELRFLQRLREKLQADAGVEEIWACNNYGAAPVFRGRQSKKIYEHLLNTEPADLTKLYRYSDEFEQRLLETRKKYTVADVEQMDDHVELIRGKIHAEIGVPTPMWDAIFSLCCALLEYMKTHGLSDKVFRYSIGLYVSDILGDEKDTLLLPDIMVVGDTKTVDEDGVHGVPKFVAEVTTERTRAIDYNEKRELYCKMGVEEYWVVDIQRKVIIKYLKKDDYVPVVCVDFDNVEVFSYPGLVIRIDSFLEEE